ALELDVHSEPDRPGSNTPAGEWRVYHTSSAEDFSCRYLSDCLELLRNFHYAVPQHEVINVIVELKNTVSYTGVLDKSKNVHNNFATSDNHDIPDFDAIFRRVLGPTLYTPADFFRDAGCDPNDTKMTLRACAKTKGWPTIDKLRGKFII